MERKSSNTQALPGIIRLPRRQRPPLWPAGYLAVSHMPEHGIWTTEDYLGAGIGLESRKETSRGKRCFKGHGSGVWGRRVI